MYVDYSSSQNKYENIEALPAVPEEIFHEILGQLNIEDLPLAASVNRHWRTVSIDVARRKLDAETQKMSAFTNYLEEYLNPGQKERRAIANQALKILNSMDEYQDSLAPNSASPFPASTNPHPVKSKNFTDYTRELFKNDRRAAPFKSMSAPPFPAFGNQIKAQSSIFTKKKEIFEKLMKLKLDKLQKLENSSKSQPKPDCFKNLFALVKMNQSINDARNRDVDNTGWSPDARVAAKAHICFEGIFNQNTNIKESIQDAKLISDLDARYYILRSISESLIEEGRFDKAEAVLRLTPQSDESIRVFKCIYAALNQGKQFVEARKMAQRIPDVIC